MEKEPAATRILVPRSRAGRNVLADALRAKGFEVVEFPALEIQAPSDLSALDAAVRHLDRFQWLLVSGEHSVQTFLVHLDAAGGQPPEGLAERIVALGMGTVGAFHARGLRPAHAPREHAPAMVVQVMAPLEGKRVLLVREETAESAMADALRVAGAEVTDVAGYRLVVRVDEDVIETAFEPAPDLVALPNPTAARVLRRALERAGPRASIEGIPVWAVGPSTAEAAERYGFPVAHVSAGRLRHLVGDLVEHDTA